VLLPLTVAFLLSKAKYSGFTSKSEMMDPRELDVEVDTIPRTRCGNDHGRGFGDHSEFLENAAIPKLLIDN
jgi:hypothetical protein